MADLAITQLFLEVVLETERGIVNGVQSSINKLMSTLEYTMVIIAPQINVFGILIIISFLFVCNGWILYAVYSRKARGHIFHFRNIVDHFNDDSVLTVDPKKTHYSSFLEVGNNAFLHA